MPKPLQNPKYSDTWYGTGAVGRWVGRGQYEQSPLPPTRSAWDWTSRWSQYGLRGLLEKHGIQFDYNTFQPLPQPTEPTGPEGPVIERLSDTPLDPRTVSSSMNAHDLSPETLAYMQQAGLELPKSIPLVALTGGYQQGYDFSNLPKHSEGWDQLTPTEQTIYTALGSDQAGKLFGYAEAINTTFDHIKNTPGRLWAEGSPTSKIKAALSLPFSGAAYLTQQGLHNLATVLDVGAEGLERTLGTLYQIRKDPELQGIFQGQNGVISFSERDMDVLAKAWESSSLFYDAIAPPTGLFAQFLPGSKERAIYYASGVVAFLAGPDRWLDWLTDNADIAEADREKFRDMYPRVREHWRSVLDGGATETGGLPALIAARTRLSEGASLEEVKAEFNDQLGALSIRAMTFDAGMHTLADPINYILPRLKVGEEIRGLRAWLDVNRVSPEVSEAVAAAAPIIKDIAFATSVEGGYRAADWTEQIADLARFAEQAQLDELTTAVAKIAEGGEGVAEAAQTAERIVDQLGEIAKMTQNERTILGVLGGADAFGGPGKAERLFLNMTDPSWLLTKRSRATQFIQNVTDNVRILVGGADISEAEMVAKIKSAAAGAFGGTFGHMLINSTGRQVQEVYRRYANMADELLNIWTQTAGVRGSAEKIATIMGTDIVALLERLKIKGGAQAVFDEFVTALRSLPEDISPALKKDALGLLEQVDAGNLTQKALADIAVALGRTKEGRLIPYTRDMFRAIMVSEMTEQAGFAAVANFGIQAEGWAQKALNTVRATESLLLLGLNPKYPVQNFFNNEITMLARGIWNNMSSAQIKDFWRAYDFVPARLNEAFGTIAGSTEELLARGNIDAAFKAGLTVVNDAIKGQPTKLDALTQFVKNTANSINPLKGKDFRNFAANIESYARARAYTAGMMKAWDTVWVPGRGFTMIDDLIPGFSDELRAINPELADTIVEAITNAKRPEDIDRIIKGVGDYRLNYDTLVRKVEEADGVNASRIRQFLDSELGQSLRTKLNEVSLNPTQEGINGIFDDVIEAAQKQFDDLAEGSLEARRLEYATIAATEGPPGAWDLWAEITRLPFERHMDHFTQLDVGIERINQMTPAFQRLEWDALTGNAARDWKRTWDTSQAMVDGLVDGLKNAGMDESFGRAISDNWKALRTANENFFEFKNKTWSEFYGKAETWASFEERNARYLEIVADLDRRYVNLREANMASWQRIDGALVKLTENPTSGLPLFGNNRENRLGEAVRNWRAMLRDMRQQDFLEVQNHVRSLQGLGRADRTAAWTDFNLARQQKLRDIQTLEVAGRSIFSGDQDAMAFLLNVDAPLDDIRLVDVMISGLDDTILRQALGDVPGGERILAQIDASPDPVKALEELRNTYRSGNLETLIRQADTQFVGDDIQPAIEKVQRIFNYDPQYQGDEIARLTQRYLNGDVNPEIEKMLREFEVTRLRGTGLQGRPQEGVAAAADDLYALGYKNQNFLIQRSGNGWELQMADGTIIGRSLAEGPDELIDQARNMVEASIRNDWTRRTFGDRAVELNRVTDLLQKPLRELDDDLAKAVQDAARELRSELSGTIGPRPSGEAVAAAGGKGIRGRGPSDNPDWYSALYFDENYKNKNAILNALEGIGSGNDKWGPRNYEIARNAILDRLRLHATDEHWGPDFVELMRQRDLMPGMPNPVRPPDNLNIEDNIRMFLAHADEIGDPVPADIFQRLLGLDGIQRTGNRQNFINRMEQMVPREMYRGDGLDALHSRYNLNLLESMRNQAHVLRQSPTPDMFDLPPETMQKLLRYTDHVKGQLNDARMTASKIAEGIADGALLNYSKQYHWDAWMSYVMPYGYWYTHSAAAWLAHSLDRPGMLSTYYKMKRYLDQAVGDQQGMPERLQGKIKIPLPFAPKWMGDWYVDPLSAFGLPFEGFARPWETWGKKLLAEDQGTQNILSEMLRSNQITQEEYDAAIASKSGPAWQMAEGISRERYTNNDFDLYDFMSLSVSPHLPLQYAWNLVRGTPENITPLPATRTIKAVGDLLGISPGWYDSTWGNVRRSLGLPGFDQWDDYRLNRELSTMVGEGLITVDEYNRTMIERSGEWYDMAQERVNQTGGFRYLLGLAGLPLSNYPAGERELRSLNDDFRRALDIRDNGNPQALSDFFEQHPEYETRLGLWDDPQTFLRKVLVDQVWGSYMELSSLNKGVVRDALGDDFQRLFLDKETRSVDDVPAETLAMWIKMMGGDAPGTLGDNALPITLAPPEIAAQAQVFYDYRNTYFPNSFELQSAYFDLEGNEARANFLTAHPELEAYWKWRDEVLPNHQELMDAYFLLSPDGPRDKFLQDYPELQSFWDKASEIFPNHSELAQQYALTPDYLKRDFRSAHPELVAYWQYRDQQLPNWEAYYDYYFSLGADSQRDIFLGQHPELAGFWEQRDQEFPGITDISKLYSQLPQSDARSDYLKAHPELQAYWDWRNDFLNNNPGIVPYIDDEYQPNYGSEAERTAAYANQPQFTWQEWSLQMSIPLQETVLDYILVGEPLSDAAETQLTDLADAFGVDLNELLALIEQSVSP